MGTIPRCGEQNEGHQDGEHARHVHNDVFGRGGVGEGVHECNGGVRDVCGWHWAGAANVMGYGEDYHETQT